MAFKPIIKETEIKGITYKAQYNGISAMQEIGYLANEDMRKTTPYLFEHVLVEPKIKDIDEYFGTDTKHYNEVLNFLLKVAQADPEYFPEAEEEPTATKNKG